MPEWRSEEPIAHRTVENLPGYIVQSASQRLATEITFSKYKTGLQKAYREQIIDIDHDFGLLQRQSVSMSRTRVAPFGGFAGRHGGGGEVQNEETAMK